MTPADLRAAIAADCPHRLDDHDRHLNGRQPTAAFVWLWRIEHAISSQPDVEAQLDRLYRRVENSADYTEIKSLLEQASSIRYQIREELK